MDSFKDALPVHESNDAAVEVELGWETFAELSGGTLSVEFPLLISFFLMYSEYAATVLGLNLHFFMRRSRLGFPIV